MAPGPSKFWLWGGRRTSPNRRPPPKKHFLRPYIPNTAFKEFTRQVHIPPKQAAQTFPRASAPLLSTLPGAPNPSCCSVSSAFHTPGHPQPTRARGVERGPETRRGFSAAGPSPPRSRPISRSKKALAGIVGSLASGKHHFQNIFTSLEHRK